MGFGAVIALGEDNRPLDADLAGGLVEVRVEQTLDEPTRFAIRLLDDIEDGALRLTRDKRLEIDQLVTIAVDVGGELRCLVRGPIVRQASQMTLGGPGSWFEVHGLDRRDLLDRACPKAARTGRATDAAKTILGRTFAKVDVENSTRNYEQGKETLNQRSTDLDFVTQVARRNNMHLWITYECNRPPGGHLRVTETAHLASSPPRSQGGGALTGPPALVATSKLELRVNVPARQCPNVTAFKLDLDGQRPSRYRAGAMSTTDAQASSVSASDPQPAARGGAKRLDQLGGAARELCLPGIGDPQDTQARGEAALTEAGWYVQATASTTRHLLRGVLAPHDVVSAVGLGPKHGQVPLRVKAVTHVINAAEHFMDLKLECNGFMEK